MLSNCDSAFSWGLSLRGKPIGKYVSLYDCWGVINAAYDTLYDRYGDVLRVRIHHLESGESIGLCLQGGSWDACCETPKAFVMYLDLLGLEGLIGMD